MPGLDLFAITNGSCIPGSYLVKEGSGTWSIWTFSKDGTVEFSSSAQGAFHFSDARGAWRKTRSLEAKLTLLDFTFGATPQPDSIARVDATFSFSKKCTTLEGNFELRFFDPVTEDPLDINSDSGDPVSDTFTGRRIQTQR
jgi:hypothetical protein